MDQVEDNDLNKQRVMQDLEDIMTNDPTNTIDELIKRYFTNKREEIDRDAIY